MKPGLPWSIKGIEPDVREAAKQAAKRSGMTLGEWLNSRILEDSESSGANPDAAPKNRAGRPPEFALERTASRLEDIAESLARLSQRENSTLSRIGIRPAEQVAQDDAAMQRVLGRVEANERQTVEAFSAVNDRLTSLSRQISQAVKSNRPEDTPSYQALEKAMRGIVEHMEVSDKRSREQFKSLQDRVANLSQRPQTSPNDQTLRQAPAFARLEQRMGELARRVEQSEQSRPTGLPDLLRQELEGLAERIDTVRDTAEQLASRAQTQAVQASQQELRAIETRIQGLLREAQSSLSGTTVGPAEIQRLRGEIERLNKRIDEVQNRPAADNGDVRALRTAVEQLSTRVAQGPDPKPFAEMDRRILDISARLEQTQAATRSMPQFADLESRIAELDHRFNEVVAGRASAHSEDIENRLNEVSERVARTEQHFASIETIERAVNQLFDTFEQQRTWTQQVAEDAANRMAERIAAQGPQQVSLAGSPEIMALEQGLQAVRQAAETSDHRNQETLEAVHETLEQIVTKLAELETAAIGQRLAAVAAPQAAAAAPFPPQPEPATPLSNPMEPAIPAFELGPVVSAGPNQQEPEFPPLRNPLEEAMTPPPGNPLIGAPPFVEAPTAAVPSHETGDDFIAAARRAAQASQNQKSIFAGVAPGVARLSEQSSRKLLDFAFLKRKGKKPAELPGVSGEIKPPPGFKPANNNDGKRRRLLVMGLVLLAAVSAFTTFNMLGRANKAKPVKPQQTIEAPAKPEASNKAPESKVVPKQEPMKPAQVQQPPKPQEMGSKIGNGLDDILTASTSPAEDVASAIAADDALGNSDMPPAEVGSLQLREAAALGNAEAQFVVATRYQNGDKVKQDFARAAYWYGKAAAQGLAPAQYRVATLYEKGKGVPKDLRAALGWYERAAALGNIKAMHNAAVLSAGNEIGAPDYAKAYKWFSLGAAHGLKDSQYNLAVLLERGLGTAKSTQDAMFWYMVAAHQDDQEALKRANGIAKTLTQTERKKVQDKVAAWVPEKAPEAANVIAVNNRAWAGEPNG